MRNLEQLISKTIFQLRLNAVLKAILGAMGLALIVLGLGLGVNWSMILSGCIFLISILVFGMFKDQRKKAKRILHGHFEGLEYSLELLDKRERNVAEELQLKRISKQYQNSRPPQVFIQSLLPFIIFLLVSGGIFGMGILTKKQAEKAINPIESRMDSASEKTTRKPIVLEVVNVLIQPPTYTGEKNYLQNELNIKALEGSTVSWSLVFSTEDSLKVLLTDAGGNQMPFKQKGADFALSDRLTGSGIYAIKAYQKDSLIYESEYYTLEAVLDKSPIILPEEKELYRFHFSKDPFNYKLQAKISDDYLVRQTYLVATLARGSGENVKFRENRIALTPTNFKNTNISHQLDLAAMDFQPGDELYYYWLAIDNKQPEANISKSETFFIQYVDSTGMTENQLAGMAIHVLPDYFRSQRQIIIDTEKLIAGKSKIAEKKFNENSNELGHEQKLLRMRYGQYLGEEYETNAPGGSFTPEAGEDLLEGFRHDHDHEGEHDLQDYEEKPIELPDDHQHEHDHGNESNSDNELSFLLENYLHNHDSEESNTFYEQSTRGMLKMALEQMWQSELHLRLFEPEKALPYQKKALDYLKSVQQKSRVYVKKTGFDPPPIKEAEKRLTGELEDVRQLRQGEIEANQNRLAFLASNLVGFLNRPHLSNTQKQTVQDFGELWVERMENSGFEDWNTLLLVQKLGSGELTALEKEKLYEKLVPVLNSQKRNNPTGPIHKELAKSFWENLK